MTKQLARILAARGDGLRDRPRATRRDPLPPLWRCISLTDSGGAIWAGGTIAVGIQSGCRDTTADLDKYCDANQPVYSHVRLAFSYFYPISLYTGD